MKAVILLGTLKKEGLSNTETLAEFFAGRLQKQGIEYEIIKLVNKNVLPGTYHDMGPGDDWPAILQKITDAGMVIFATPVWWGGHSSEIQKVIERLDKVHDEILAGMESRLADKGAGILITGDSDGAQHIIGNLCNFLNAVGVIVPPYGALSVLWEGQKKEATTTKEELMKKYEGEYTETADTMISQLSRFAGK